ncbi:hypothetical protein C3489_32290 [Streptomyces sp. Ru71]|uniref:hypothetical protein n=1 Tax=Streptomyces sp. Ru71 TaxID=2080746 RepID=UPI000CDDBDF3|nr:hypothetical protein [Streptomyces sp. Ru71]POX46273.1 hypothetical protein C3489_32290 [Streptomyces sp. Ru71]
MTVPASHIRERLWRTGRVGGEADAMPVRHRTRTLPARTRRLAAAVALAVLAAGALTACRDGEGLRDEGPSHALRAPQRSFWATSVAQ